MHHPAHSRWQLCHCWMGCISLESVQAAAAQVLMPLLQGLVQAAAAQKRVHLLQGLVLQLQHRGWSIRCSAGGCASHRLVGLLHLRDWPVCHTTASDHGLIAEHVHLLAGQLQAEPSPQLAAAVLRRHRLPLLSPQPHTAAASPHLQRADSRCCSLKQQQQHHHHVQHRRHQQPLPGRCCPGQLAPLSPAAAPPLHALL